MSPSRFWRQTLFEHCDSTAFYSSLQELLKFYCRKMYKNNISHMFVYFMFMKVFPCFISSKYLYKFVRWYDSQYFEYLETKFQRKLLF